MSTSSTIALENADGTILQVYCHSDGYPTGVGATLENHYNTPDQIKALLALGDVSVLDASIECPEGHSFDTRIKGHTVFYGRDRGETDCDAILYSCNSDWRFGDMQEYNYIFRHETQSWEVSNSGEKSSLITS